MTNANDNAHPYVKFDEDNMPFVDSNMTGLTKREYFAAMALQGVLRHPNQADGTPHTYNTIALTAVAAADALIEALNKNQ